MGVELLSPAQDAASSTAAGGANGDLFSGLDVIDDAGVNAVKSMLQQPAPPPAFAVPSIGGVAAAVAVGAGAYSPGGAGIGVKAMAAPGVSHHPWMAHAQPMPAPHMWVPPGSVSQVMHAAAGTAQFNPAAAAAAFPHSTAMHAAAYGGVQPMGMMPMGYAGQVPGAWTGGAAHGLGHGIASHGGTPAGAARMGAAGRAPVDFDFSSDPTVRSPAPKASTETTKAFDFVTVSTKSILPDLNFSRGHNCIPTSLPFVKELCMHVATSISQVS